MSFKNSKLQYRLKAIRTSAMGHHGGQMRSLDTHIRQNMQENGASPATSFIRHEYNK